MLIGVLPSLADGKIVVGWKRRVLTTTTLQTTSSSS